MDATHGIVSRSVKTGIEMFFTGHVYQDQYTSKYTIISRWDTDKRFITLFKKELAQQVADTFRRNTQGVRYIVMPESELK